MRHFEIVDPYRWCVVKWSCHVLATPIKLHRAASSLRNAGGLIRLSSTVLARLHRSATSSP